MRGMLQGSTNTGAGAMSILHYTYTSPNTATTYTVGASGPVYSTATTTMPLADNHKEPTCYNPLCQYNKTQSLFYSKYMIVSKRFGEYTTMFRFRYKAPTTPKTIVLCESCAGAVEMLGETSVQF